RRIGEVHPPHAAHLDGRALARPAVAAAGAAAADVVASEPAAPAEAAVEAGLVAAAADPDRRQAGRALLHLDGEVGPVLDDHGDAGDGVADLHARLLREGRPGESRERDGGQKYDGGFQEAASLSCWEQGAAAAGPSHFKSRS